jgi:hypothetical protein
MPAANLTLFAPDLATNELRVVSSQGVGTTAIEGLSIPAEIGSPVGPWLISKRY